MLKFLKSIYIQSTQYIYNTLSKLLDDAQWNDSVSQDIPSIITRKKILLDQNFKNFHTLEKKSHVSIEIEGLKILINRHKPKPSPIPSSRTVPLVNLSPVVSL